MPDYKVVDADQLNADMTSVADAIRAKGGATEKMAWPAGFVSAVEGLQAGGADVSGVTATEADVLAGKKFVDSGGTLTTGTLEAGTVPAGKKIRSVKLISETPLAFIVQNFSLGVIANVDPYSENGPFELRHDCSLDDFILGMDIIYTGGWSDMTEDDWAMLSTSMAYSEGSGDGMLTVRLAIDG